MSQDASHELTDPRSDSRIVWTVDPLRENHRGTKDHNEGVGGPKTSRSPFEESSPSSKQVPMLSCKQEEFITFAGIVREMERGVHLDEDGFRAARR